ncbi:MAG TPA: transposase, partial [Streptosporangiaceae bacterium]|nr:transposase [Streptosporangiaceae bacterium]
MNHDQGCLLPAGIRSWLPPDHLSWQVIAVTGQLDLSRFAAAYRADGQGQAPYDPAMMLGLLFYCYFKGIRSSRNIKRACVDDLGCRVICGGAVPSHRAVTEFLRRHRGEVRRLFVQVLSLLAAEGAIAGHVVAVDGSPVSGNASRFANLDREQLAERVAALEAAIEAEAEAWLAGAEQADGAGQQPLQYDDDDDDDDGPGGVGGGLPRRLAAMAARLGRLRAAQDKLAERALASARSPHAQIARAEAAAEAAARRLEQAEAAQAAVMEKYHTAVAAGKCWRFGKIPVPAQQNKRIIQLRERAASAAARLAAARDRAAALSPARVCATDPDSRLLPAKNGGGYLQGWNIQAAAARRQVLTAIELHDNPADAGALITMIAAAAANCDLAGLRGQIRAWLADNGYASAANFTALEHLLLLVAVHGEAAQTGRRPGGTALPPGWEKMAARLATPAGKRLYKRRAAQVEPFFAQFFARF